MVLIFNSLLLLYRNSAGFKKINHVFIIFINSTVSPSKVLQISFGFYRKQPYHWQKRTHKFSPNYLFFLCYCSGSVVKILNTMSKRSGESRLSFFVSNLREKAFSITIKYMGSFTFYIYIKYILKYIYNIYI